MNLGQHVLNNEIFLRLTSTPHLPVPIAVTGSVLRPLLLALLLLAASEHLVEEVELGLGDRHEKEKSPEGLAPALQHNSNNHTDSNCRVEYLYRK